MLSALKMYTMDNIDSPERQIRDECEEEVQDWISGKLGRVEQESVVADDDHDPAEHHDKRFEQHCPS